MCVPKKDQQTDSRSDSPMEGTTSASGFGGTSSISWDFSEILTEYVNAPDQKDFKHYYNNIIGTDKTAQIERQRMYPSMLCRRQEIWYRQRRSSFSQAHIIGNNGNIGIRRFTT